MKEQDLKIVYRGYGIADRFSDGTIELNKALDDYPKLKKSIIQHEIRHTSNQKINKKDFLHDLSTPDQVGTFQMFKFMARHPLSLVQFLPVYWTKKRGLIVDLNLIIIYSILIVIAGGISLLALFV